MYYTYNRSGLLSGTLYALRRDPLGTPPGNFARGGSVRVPLFYA